MRDVCKGGSRSVINEIDYDIQVEVIINCTDFDGLVLGKCDEVENIFEEGSGGREFERNKEWEVYRNRILRLFEGRREEVRVTELSATEYEMRDESYCEYRRTFSNV